MEYLRFFGMFFIIKRLVQHHGLNFEFVYRDLAHAEHGINWSEIPQVIRRVRATVGVEE